MVRASHAHLRSRIGVVFRSSSVCEIGALYCRGGSTHGMFKLKAIALCVHANAGRKMPLAQAHPFQPMPVTHEEADPQEVSGAAVLPRRMN